MCLEDRPRLEPNAAGIDVGSRETRRESRAGVRNLQDSWATRNPSLFSERAAHEGRTGLRTDPSRSGYWKLYVSLRLSLDSQLSLGDVSSLDAGDREITITE